MCIFTETTLPCIALERGSALNEVRSRSRIGCRDTRSADNAFIATQSTAFLQCAEGTDRRRLLSLREP